MMTGMVSPTPPLLTSAANPRVRKAAALRDRRERDSTGLTLIDGARELRRALDAGVTVVDAFVCEPLLAGADARAALDRLRERGTPIHPTTETVFAKLAFGERAEGLVAVARSRRPASTPSTSPTMRSSPSSRGSRSRATSARCCGARTAPVSTRSSPPRHGPTCTTRTPSGQAPERSSPSHSRRHRPTDVLAWLRDSDVRILAARVDAERLYTDVDLTGPCRARPGRRGRGPGRAWAGDDIEAIRLPMHGVADSLNVSVSAAILFYEARRQRDLPGTSARR